MGYSPWGLKELDGTERLTLSLFFFKDYRLRKSMFVPNSPKFILRCKTSCIRPTSISIFFSSKLVEKNKLCTSLCGPQQVNLILTPSNTAS